MVIRGWIHRLTYKRTNHHNIHVRGYKEEGTITTPFDMTVLNDMDRFHLVMDVIERLPQLEKCAYLKQEMQEVLILHRAYINREGIDMPEILNYAGPEPAGWGQGRHEPGRGRYQRDRTDGSSPKAVLRAVCPVPAYIHRGSVRGC